MSRSNAPLRLLLALCSLALPGTAILPGCAPRSGEWVRHVRFDGNEAGLENPNGDAVLRDVLEQESGDRPTLLRPRQDTSRLSRDALRRDVARVETRYAHHGRFDAKVEGWVVIRRGAREGRLKPVEVVGYLDPGEPTLINKVRLDGLPEPEDGKPEDPIRRRLRGLIDIAPGDTFDLATYTHALSAIRAGLQERSYAYATVSGEVLVDPATRRADIVFTVVRGPACRFGAVTISGSKKVPSDRLTLNVKEGEPYHPSAMAETRQSLFALRVFRLVDVIPDLSDPTRTSIPVRVEVRDTKTRSVKLGLVLNLENGLQSVGASAIYQDWNVARRLWTWEQEVFGGIGHTGIVSSTIVEDASGTVAPIFAADGTLTFTRILPALDFVNGGRIERGLEPGYLFTQFSYAPSFVIRRWERHAISLGYRVKYNRYNFLDADVAEELRAEEPDGVLENPYLLSLLEQSWSYDGRNDRFSPSRGWYLFLKTAEAGAVLQGDFAYLRLEGETRTYRSLIDIAGWDPDVILAGRLGAGLLLPFDPALGKAAVPLDERLFLGGADTVRGWGYNRLGPLISGTETPEGGLARAYGSFEIRRALPWSTSAVAFLDAGRVWDGLGTMGLTGIQLTVGGGLRYTSVAGPLRLDLGVRLGEDRIGTDPRLLLHFGLGEAF